MAHLRVWEDFVVRDKGSRKGISKEVENEILYVYFIYFFSRLCLK